ncbi:MAG: hypothetical protein J0M10_16610 [Chitinophagales bacterium]|nr:hypothetical protein [Chitinophagales bacterium]
MKSPLRSIPASSAIQLKAVKKTPPSSDQIKSAYLKAILSGSRIVSSSETAIKTDYPDRMAAIRYIRDSAAMKKKE